MTKKFVSLIVIVAFVMMTSGILLLNPSVTMAASITGASDTLSRLKASTDSDQTIVFTTPSGIANSATIILTFNNGTDTTDVVVGDVDVLDGATPITVVSGTPGATEWRFVNTSPTVLTFTLGSGAAVLSTHVITIKIGTNATGGVNMIKNGAAGATTLTITGSMADSGIISMYIISDDQVSITASVNPTLTFDLDTAADFTNGESDPLYAVPLGVLSAAAVTHSNGTSIRMIVVDGGTNASGGMNISVRNANGSDGLKSTSTIADHISSSTGTMAINTPNYGLCVATGGLTGFVRAAGTYDAAACALTSGTNSIRGLTSTAADIVTSPTPIAAGQAEIVVNASIDGATPAHTDYADTLTFIATASY